MYAITLFRYQRSLLKKEKVRDRMSERERKLIKQWKHE